MTRFHKKTHNVGDPIPTPILKLAPSRTAIDPPLVKQVKIDAQGLPELTSTTDEIHPRIIHVCIKGRNDWNLCRIRIDDNDSDADVYQKMREAYAQHRKSGWLLNRLPRWLQYRSIDRAAIVEFYVLPHSAASIPQVAIYTSEKIQASEYCWPPERLTQQQYIMNGKSLPYYFTWWLLPDSGLAWYHRDKTIQRMPVYIGPEVEPGKHGWGIALIEEERRFVLNAVCYYFGLFVGPYHFRVHWICQTGEAVVEDLEDPYEISDHEIRSADERRLQNLYHTHWAKDLRQLVSQERHPPYDPADRKWKLITAMMLGCVLLMATITGIIAWWNGRKCGVYALLVSLSAIWFAYSVVVFRFRREESIWEHNSREVFCFVAAALLCGMWFLWVEQHSYE